jgi:glycerol kinase
LSLLGIDAGVDGVAALVVDEDGDVLATGHHPFASHAAGPGRVELAPDEVWRAMLEATRAVLARVDPTALRGVGLSGASDVLVLWDRMTLGPPRPALAADDRRAESAQMDHRLAWLARHEPRTWAAVASGEYAVGGPAAYLVARLTRGTWHVTDVAAAARSGLCDLDSGTWSGARCAGAGLPVDVLPEPVASWGVLDRTDARSFCGLELPIAGLAAAAPATLLGRGGGRPGDATHVAAEGTLLVLTDPAADPTTGTPAAAPAGALRPTLAWRAPDGSLTRALTASVSGEEVAAVLAAVPGATLRTPGAHDAARGAAYLAGLGTGVWSSPAGLPGAATRPG